MIGFRYPAWKAGWFSFDHFSFTGGDDGFLAGAGAEAGFSSAIAVSVREMTSSSSVLRLCSSSFSGSACRPE